MKKTSLIKGFIYKDAKSSLELIGAIIGIVARVIFYGTVFIAAIKILFWS